MIQQLSVSFKGLLGSLLVLFLLFTPVSPAQPLPNDVKDVGKFVNLSSVSSDYKVHNASIMPFGTNQIVFLNKKNGQRMSFTFANYMTALTGERLEGVLQNLRNPNSLGNEPSFTQEVTTCGDFDAQGQKVFCCLLNQYNSGRPMSKALYGVIPNLNGKFIFIQSFAHPDQFNEALAKKFFTGIEFKTEAF